MIKFKVTFTVLFICFCLTSFSGHNKRNETIGEINRNCNVPFALTLPESALENIKEYSMIGGFGSYLLENEDVSVTISGYPDCLDKYHIGVLPFEHYRMIKLPSIANNTESK